MTVESNEDYAKRMRRKRIPAVECLMCGGSTHVDDGAHQCAGLRAETFGAHGHFEMKDCNGQPLCRGCTHCPECGAEMDERHAAYREHQKDLEHAAAEEAKRNDERARARAMARTKIAEDLAAKRPDASTLMAALQHGDTKVLGALFGRLISEGKISVTNFRTEADVFTPQTRFTVEMTGWIEHMLNAAEQNMKAATAGKPTEPSVITRAGMTHQDQPEHDEPEAPDLKGLAMDLLGKDEAKAVMAANPKFSREYLCEPATPQPKPGTNPFANPRDPDGSFSDKPDGFKTMRNRKKVRW